ncbi:hypothetical protein [Streptomyces lavendofoliae]|nr:hypothetical protein [Streptomyces lavendofoliae]
MTLTAFHTVLQRWSDTDGMTDPARPTDDSFAVLAPAPAAVTAPAADASAEGPRLDPSPSWHIAIGSPLAESVPL